MKKTSTIALMVIVAIMSAHATEPTGLISGTGSIEGFVRNDLGQTIPFATVWLERNGNILIQGQATLDGAYAFNGLQPGSYSLGASMMSYTDTVVQVEVRSDNISFVDLVIVRSGFLFRPVTIRPSIINPGDPTPRTIWNPEKLGNLPSLSSTAAVALTPSVYVQDDGDQGSGMGGRPSHNVTIIDDVVVRGFVDVPIDAIQELSVYLTGVPSRYGDFLGAAVIINTKSF